MQINTILFDLDGTLTDPGEGVVRCLRHALETLGFPVPSGEAMASYIGPPLRENFAALCGSNDREVIEQGVALYRERYGRVGAYENQVYNGVEAMLEELGSSYTLYVATSKTQPFAELVLEHFGLTRHFRQIHGGTFDARLDDKARLVAELVATHALDPATTVMVGDRRYDIEAARANGLRSIGVTYGYGSREELVAAGADLICESPAAVLTCFSEWRGDQPKATHRQ